MRLREDRWNKEEKKALKTEIEKLQKQQFILRMKTIGRVIVHYKKDQHLKPGDEDPNVKVDPHLDQVSKVAQRRAYREERESVAEQFYAKIRQILLGSDVMRLRAKLDLRKEMTRDFKDKYQRVAESYMKLKSDINVSRIQLKYIDSPR